jgi:hypothetical protein
VEAKWKPQGNHEETRWKPDGNHKRNHEKTIRKPAGNQMETMRKPTESHVDTKKKPGGIRPKDKTTNRNTNTLWGKQLYKILKQDIGNALSPLPPSLSPLFN